MRALALFSGGLDSMLAMKLITLQNIEVHALFFNTGFLWDVEKKKNTLKKRAESVKATFEIIDIRDNYIKEILLKPTYGYGKNFNPCIDCHGYMFKIAKQLLKKYKASFIISGEVVGQRPMSQRLAAMEKVKELANDKDNIILRPLSAKLLPKTKPEILGWVDREKLLAIKGRSRKTQLQLAKSLGLKDYQNPAGGCLLTEIAFSNRLKKFIETNTLEKEDIEVLKVGRYFKLHNCDLIVGRNHQENERIELIKNDKFGLARALTIPGPNALLKKDTSDNNIKHLAAKIILTYTKAKTAKIYPVKIDNETIYETPFDSKDKCRRYLVI